jgi:hypothetical protein
MLAQLSDWAMQACQRVNPTLRLEVALLCGHPTYQQGLRVARGATAQAQQVGMMRVTE